MAGPSLLGGRGTGWSQMLIVFLGLLVIFLFRDMWLPNAQSAYHAGSPIVHEPAEQSNSEPQTQPSPSAIHDETAAPTHHSSSDDKIETCAHLPGADKVLVMLKTGATELYQKLPTHFVTTFKCIPNFMIFSDLEQKFGDIQIYDAIAPVSQGIREEHRDFALYREIAKYQKEGQDMSKLSGEGGWDLDKWKFLPMLHQAFESADKDIKWFVMMEADTSLSWLNLLLWLKTMDPQKPYYLGAQNVIGDTTFAHGGSGVVISRRAADMLEAARNNNGKATYDQAWEKQTSESCCGDAIIAEALLAVDVPLTMAWPLIQGETVSTVDFTNDHWCAPAISWHHVSPIEVEKLWRFERDWTDKHGWEKPYLYRDVFSQLIEPHVTVNRTHWNNLSGDHKYVAPSLANAEDSDFYSLEKYEQESVESEDACAQACMHKGDQCIQWMFQPGRCYLGKDIRFGKSDDRDGEHWNCGWIQDRLASFIKEHEGCSIRWEG